MSDPLDGINEKLKRAHENIVNLQSEMTAFFEKSERPIVGNEDFKVLMEKAIYQGERELPLRFSVIAGEILHHFRSTLDHAAWILVRPECRTKSPTRIEFPIFHDRFKKDGSPSLEGKIEMFASDATQKIIRDVQPYEGIDPSRDLLWLIHDLDRIAKHRELPLMVTGFDFGSPAVNAAAMFYAANPSVPMSADFARQLKNQMRLAPVIAFRQFCKGEPSPVIPSLVQLKGEVHHVIGLLDSELRK